MAEEEASHDEGNDRIKSDQGQVIEVGSAVVEHHPAVRLYDIGEGISC
jgi:hypothetical protein